MAATVKSMPRAHRRGNARLRGLAQMGRCDPLRVLVVCHARVGVCAFVPQKMVAHTTLMCGPSQQRRSCRKYCTWSLY